MSPQTSFLLLWLAVTTPPAPHAADFPFPQLPAAEHCEAMYAMARAEVDALDAYFDAIGADYLDLDDWEPPAVAYDDEICRPVLSRRRYTGFIHGPRAGARRAAVDAARAWYMAAKVTGGYHEATRDAWAEALHHLIGERAMMLGDLPLPLSLRR